jgi:UDP-N-acetylmuramoylalanine--D-glutamate ligase
MERDLRARAVWFSRRETIPYGAFVRNGRVVFRSKDSETELFETDAIPLKGTHNLENVLAACTMAILAGAQPDSLETGVRQFKGVEHRIEFVRRLGEVQYYNDSKATNVAATLKSLEAFPQNILLIAGGRDKEGDFTLLRSPVRQRVKHLVLIGEAGQKIRDALSGMTDATDAQSMEEAVAICRKLAQPGDIVLLAPACASFDMFENYEHRGRVFKKAVNDL